MTAPEFMPVLKAGKHRYPFQGACVMEYVSILAGEPFDDRPNCTLWLLGEWARDVNDSLSDTERQALLPLIPRLIGTSRPDYNEERDIGIALMSWANTYYPLGSTGFGWDPSPRYTVEFLTAALDEYDRLTGRQPTGMAPDEYAALEAKRQEMAG